LKILLHQWLSYIRPNLQLEGMSQCKHLRASEMG
jgi:hypothetical protein